MPLPWTIRRLSAEPEAIARLVPAVRVAIAAGLLAAPEFSLRSLGVDTATARRVTWLTRMMAVRDGVLGAGGAAAARRGHPAPWLLAAAASDAVDAVVVAHALRTGRLRGPAAAGLVALGAATAAAQVATVLRLRR